MDWKGEAERLRFDEKLSWSELYARMKPLFPDLSDKQAEERIRGYLRTSNRYKADAPVGVFSDIHSPFDLPNFPYFLQDTFKKYGVEKKVCCGDMVDSHAVSRHGAEPCALGAYSEFDLAIQRIKIYTTLFPKVDYILGNHDLRLWNQAASVGIGRRFLKELQEILGLPEGWICRNEEYEYNDVLFLHGINCTGKNGALNKALTERMSVVIGHSHAHGGVQYAANGRNKVFGLNVGCGVNEKAYAFTYGRHSKYKATIGCGIIFDSENAIFVPMGKEYY